MKNNIKPIIIIEETNSAIFEKKCQNAIENDYKFSSSSIGFISSEVFDKKIFRKLYQAILTCNIQKENIIDNPQILSNKTYQINEIEKDNTIKELKTTQILSNKTYQINEIEKDNTIKELKTTLYEIKNKICLTRKQDTACFMKNIAIEQDKTLKEIFEITAKVIG